MSRGRICLSVAVAALAALAGPANRGLAQPASAPAADAITGPEAEKVAQLDQCERAGKHGDVVSISKTFDISRSTFAFKQAVLTRQAEGYRRCGQWGSGRGSLQTLLAHAQKLPDPFRAGAVNRLLLPLQVYQNTRTDGTYVTPGAKPDPSAKGLRVADDADWAAAKQDLARNLLARTDDVMARVERALDPERVTSAMNEALAIPTMVRPHLPELANEKAAAIVRKAVTRYLQLIDGEPCLAEAQQLVAGTLWPTNRFMPIAQRQAIAEQICNNIKVLHTLNHTWGKWVSEYGRKNDMTQLLSGPLGDLASRRDRLRDTFVRTDEHVDRVFRMHAPGEPMNIPTAKLASGEW